jgi:hypothetical protein
MNKFGPLNHDKKSHNADAENLLVTVHKIITESIDDEIKSKLT